MESLAGPQGTLPRIRHKVGLATYMFGLLGQDLRLACPGQAIPVRAQGQHGVAVACMVAHDLQQPLKVLPASMLQLAGCTGLTGELSRSGDSCCVCVMPGNKDPMLHAAHHRSAGAERPDQMGSLSGGAAASRRPCLTHLPVPLCCFACQPSPPGHCGCICNMLVHVLQVLSACTAACQVQPGRQQDVVGSCTS